MQELAPTSPRVGSVLQYLREWPTLPLGSHSQSIINQTTSSRCHLCRAATTLALACHFAPHCSHIPTMQPNEAHMIINSAPSLCCCNHPQPAPPCCLPLTTHCPSCMPQPINSLLSDSEFHPGLYDFSVRVHYDLPLQHQAHYACTPLSMQSESMAECSHGSLQSAQPAAAAF